MERFPHFIFLSEQSFTHSSLTGQANDNSHNQLNDYKETNELGIQSSIPAFISQIYKHSCCLASNCETNTHSNDQPTKKPYSPYNVNDISNSVSAMTK